MLLNWLFLLTCAAFILGQIGRLSFYGGQVNVYLYEAFLVLTLLFLTLKYKLHPLRKSFTKFKTIWFFLFFLDLSFFLLIKEFISAENLIGALYLLRLNLYFIYIFYFYHHCRVEPGFKIGINKIFIWATVLIILISFVQYFFYPDLRNLAYLGWDPHYARIFGLFFDSSVAGAIYGFFFLFLVFNPGIGKKKNLSIILLGLLLIISVLTFSRSLYIALTLTLILYFLKKKAVKKILFLIAVFILILFFAPKPWGESVNLTRSSSIISRLRNYSDAIEIWQKRPIFGYGYNRIRYIKTRQGILEDLANHAGASYHSSFLTILVTGGLIGLALFILSLFELMKLNSKVFYLLFFLCLMSLSDNILLHPFILFLLPLQLID